MEFEVEKEKEEDQEEEEVVVVEVVEEEVEKMHMTKVERRVEVDEMVVKTKLMTAKAEGGGLCYPSWLRVFECVSRFLFRSSVSVWRENISMPMK